MVGHQLRCRSTDRVTQKTPLVPTPLLLPSFQFRFRTAIPERSAWPPKQFSLSDFPPALRLPHAASLDGQPTFADVSAAWNPRGLALAVKGTPSSQAKSPSTAKGKRATAAAAPAQWSLHVWIDTRDTKTIHRGNRFCQRFHLVVPTAASESPTLASVPLLNSRETPPPPDLSTAQINHRVSPDQVFAAVWIPAAAIAGFDPQNSRRWGFFYELTAPDGRIQTLALDTHFPYSYDPSLWSTLDLATAPSRIAVD